MARLFRMKELKSSLNEHEHSNGHHHTNEAFVVENNLVKDGNLQNITFS